MGRCGKCSWDDRKQAINLAHHGYDFADIEAIFDGRLLITRSDLRFDYGELRYNTLAEFEGRIVNVTFTPRFGRIHLLSARPASRDERRVYNAKSQED